MSVLGVDVGGTFTDFYYRSDGRVEVHKRPSTPENPSRAIIEGIRALGWVPEAVVHGSTVGTNTVLERTGARVAFVTTRGFRDLLEIGRQARPRVYELEPSRPPSLVPADLCFEITERLDHQGDVLQPLDLDDVSRLVAGIEAVRPDAVAVCLLFAFLNPAHERAIGEALLSAGFEVSLSHEVAPEPREFERATTTVLSAYIGPRMRRYLSDLETGLRGLGCHDLSIVQSNGGTLPAERAGQLAASTLLSGPAAGVAGAFALARRAGYSRVITLDMGGTSTDVCLCDGSIPFTSQWRISDVPVRLPAVDVHTIGAGGGSVAWLDEGGALRLGPHSAGAEPGPAAYGKGGPATPTDANLVLGRLGSESLLGGEFPISLEAARAALGQLGLPRVEDAAMGVIEVANALMARAIRAVSVEKGHDPAQFALVPFGGAGPLHACELAEALSIPTVLVPRYPGLMSAIGMTDADLTRDYAAPVIHTHEAGNAQSFLRAPLDTAAAALRALALAELGDEAVLEFTVDLRYAGQGYELNVAWDGGEPSAVVEAFHALHQRRYGHHSLDRAVELITLRLRARMQRPLPHPPRIEAGDASAEVARGGGERAVHLSKVETIPVYQREHLRSGNRLTGPAIVEQVDSTTLILRGWSGAVDREGTLVLTRGDGHGV